MQKKKKKVMFGSLEEVSLSWITIYIELKATAQVIFDNKSSIKTLNH
jgi:hypothetical protein